MKLFQAYVNDHQKTFLSPNTIPINAQDNFVEGIPQFEYPLFKYVKSNYVETDVEPWGLVSWKFTSKSIITPEEFMQFAQNKLNDGYDCAFINPMIGDEALYLNVWEQGIDTTQGFDKITNFLSQKFGSRINAHMDASTFAFCNYFIATPKFWESYFQFVDECIDSLETEAVNDTEVGRIYNGPANHGGQYKCKITPFVIERLFSSFIIGSDFKYIAYPHTVSHFRSKYGDALGDFMFQLSETKNIGLRTMDHSLLQKHHEARCAILYGSIRNTVFQMFDLSYFLSPEYKKLGLK